MSRIENIIRFISDIDIKTALPQNVIYAGLLLFILLAKGQYVLKLQVSCFLVIIQLFWFILSIFRHFYNIKSDFTISGQFCALLIFSSVLFGVFLDYRMNKSFRKNLIYEKNIPDGLLYYGQRTPLNTEVELSKHKMTIEFFEVFDDTYKGKGILCLITLKDKKTNHEKKVLASFEETLAFLGENKNKYIKNKLYDFLLDQAELLLKKNNKNGFYKEVINKIKVYKKNYTKDYKNS